MMKFLTRVCVLLLLPLSAWAVEFEEGQHYKLLEKPQATETDKVLVEAYFGYGCPHCFKLDPYLEAWAKTQPEDVDVQTVPALFGGLWNTYGQMFYALQAMGQQQATHSAIFAAIHQQGKRLKNEEEIVEFLAPLGVDTEQFSELFNGFDVRLKMQQQYKRIRGYGISHVPLVIVNGKYVTDAGMAQGPEGLMQVLNFLIEQERQSQGQAQAQ